MATTHEPTLVRGAHVSTLHALSSELSALHREMLRTGRDEVRPVRMAVLTLVVVCTDPAAAGVASEVVRRLAGNHPARAIIVVADRNASPSGVDADLSLECSTTGGADQICGETVSLTVRGAPALHLISVVTPLLLPDVPVVLWLAGAPPLDQALHAEVLKVCDRIVLDSDAYADPLATLRALADAQRTHGHLPIGDLVWAQLLHWRDVIAQSFDGHDMAPFVRGVRRIEVESCGTERSSEALLMAGWLSARLTAPDNTPPDTTITTREEEHTPTGGMLAVHLHCELDGRSADVSVQCAGDMTVTRIATSDGMQATRTMARLTPDVHALLGRELQESGEDRTYIEALQRATQLFGP